MEKKKIKKRNEIIYKISIVLLLIIIISTVLYLAPNYIRKNEQKTIELVIRDKLVTLQKEIYINDKGIIYISKEDIKELFDKNIYNDETEDFIITTYGIKVAAIHKKNNEMIVNGTKVELIDTIEQINDTIYLPISEMKNIYNIEIEYIKDNNVIVIDYLQKELAVANSKNTASVKYKPTFFSKVVDTINTGEKIFFIEKAKKGWVKIRTDKGKIGYLKESDITDLTYIRQNMESNTLNNNNAYNIKDIVVKDLNKEEMINYVQREQIIEKLIDSIMLDTSLNAVNINLGQINDDSELYLRFIIELIPRLKEIGIKVYITNNEIIDTGIINKII